MPYLLSPAGSPESLEAAISAGADEIYLGGNIFNARINAKNLDKKALISAGHTCKENNLRLYITLNTLVSDRDFPAVKDYICFLEHNVIPDAYIVQDLGLAVLLKTEFPNIVLHASTQMQQHSTGGVELLKKLGFSRIIIAREASKDNIKALCESGIECEMFVHGALCVCMSGGCLMSSMIGKRSGNKGECAQPCRLEYRGSNKYPLSLKDLCLARHIPTLAEIGVTSLKIEGRMKSPDYVYTVTKIYRRLIDQNRPANDDELLLLESIFSRGGFTDGYFTGKLGKSMFGIRSVSDKKITKKQNIRITPAKKRPSLTETAGPHPLLLPEKDKNRVISAARQVGFVLRFESECPDTSIIKKYYDMAARIDIPLWDIKKITDIEKYSDKVSVILPRTIFDSDVTEVNAFLSYAKKMGVSRTTVSNIAHLDLCRGFYIHGDYSLNVTNTKTQDVLERLSFSSILVSPETNPRFLSSSSIAKEYIVYGRIPLMQTENCILKNIGVHCREHCGGNLIDRTNAEFPIRREYKHRNIIYNSVPVYLADKINILKKSGVGLYTLLFIDEYKNEQALDKLINLCLNKQHAPFPYTRGYYK